MNKLIDKNYLNFWYMIIKIEINKNIDMKN